MLENNLGKILVTGGTGFIGGNFLSFLTKKKIRPFVFTRDTNSLKIKNELKEKVNPVECNLMNFGEVENWISENRPQTIFHLAGATLLDDPTGKTCYDLNYEATLNLFRVLRDKQVRRVVMITTADEYGNQPTPFLETMKTRPISDYAISKSKAVEAALKLYQESAFPVVILRIFTTYGYGQPEKMFLSQLIRHALLEKEFQMTDGLQKRDFVYIADVVEALFNAGITPGVEGEVINIASGKSFRLCEVAEKVWQICGTDERLLKIGARFKPSHEGFDTEGDISKAKKMLKWQPQVSFDEGLAEMIDLTRKNNT